MVLLQGHVWGLGGPEWGERGSALPESSLQPSSTFTTLAFAGGDALATTSGSTFTEIEIVVAKWEVNNRI